MLKKRQSVISNNSRWFLTSASPNIFDKTIIPNDASISCSNDWKLYGKQTQEIVVGMSDLLVVVETVCAPYSYALQQEAVQGL